MTPALPLRGFTVLVVEDDVVTLNAFKQVVGSIFGCAVLTASSAEGALQVIESGAHIDLLFSDVVMPGMNGLTLARVVRAQLPGPPIILTAGFSGAIESALTSGVVPLLKPLPDSSSKPCSLSSSVFFPQLNPQL
jgi:CheY-like chemotaxis protein